MYSTIRTLTITLGLLVLWTRPSAARPADPRIAIASDGPSQAFDRQRQRIAQALMVVLGADRSPTIIADDTTTGDFTREGNRALLARLLRDDSVDLVIAMGPLLTAEAAASPSPAKPILLTFADDVVFSQLPRAGNASGRPNLTYVGGLDRIAADLARFREVVDRGPIAVVVDEILSAAVPDLSARVAAAAADVGLPLVVVPVSGDPQAMLAALPEDIGAVYLGALPRLRDESRAELMSGLVRRGLPSYAAAGPAWVRAGALMTLTPEGARERRARRVALHAQRILLGDPAAELPVVLTTHQHMLLNMETARALGVSPSFEVLSEATQVSRDAGAPATQLSLIAAVREALARKIELASDTAALEAAGHATDEARGRLLPQVNASASLRQIDPGAASPVGPAERTAAWNVSATQVIYSEAAHTDLAARALAERGQTYELAARVLDLKLATSEAYLRVLRAKNAERIRGENLERTRAHEELAQVRISVGAGRPNEVQRWRVGVAQSQRAVVESVAVRHQAEIELNRLLRRPLERPLPLASLLGPGADEVIVDPQFVEHATSPASFDLLRQFMAEEAIDNAPELAALSQAVAARERVLSGQRRSLWLPTIALNGGVNQNFWNDGEGASTPSLPPGLPVVARDNFTWQVGVTATIPLFAGGSRGAAIDRTSAELSELRERTRALRDRIEQRVRSTLHTMGATRAGTTLSMRAREAAAENLAMVEDAYRTGVVGSIELVDAQAQALASELAEADAHYDFLVAYVRAERAAGAFTFERDARARKDFNLRISAYRRRRDR